MNLITAPLKLAAALFGVFWLFFAGIAYTVWLPAGWPDYRVGVAFVHVTLHLPFAGAVGAAHARTAQMALALKQAAANERLLAAAIDRQNASVAAWSALGRRETAEAENAVQRGQGAMAGAEKARAAISAPLPAADDACARAKVTDARLMESLR